LQALKTRKPEIDWRKRGLQQMRPAITLRAVDGHIVVHITIHVKRGVAFGRRLKTTAIGFRIYRLCRRAAILKFAGKSQCHSMPALP
jgi:hypothetical protein